MALSQRELGWHQQLFTIGHRFSPFGAAGSIACISDWSKDEARTEPSIPALRGPQSAERNRGTMARLLRSHRRRRTVQRGRGLAR